MSDNVTILPIIRIERQEKTRGEALLDFIYDEVDQRLNPNQDECWHCGGNGVTFDCIDGCCFDAESGCADCERPCMECRINKGIRAKAVREEVIKSNDPDIAVAWLKQVGRWHDGLTIDQVKAQLVAAFCSLTSQHDPKGNR